MAFNAINVLCGVGLLTTPYAMAITGTSALLLLVLIGACSQGVSAPSVGAAALCEPGTAVLYLGTGLHGGRSLACHNTAGAGAAKAAVCRMLASPMCAHTLSLLLLVQVPSHATQHTCWLPA